ncbi:Ger(x)C family spore germination protein [Paenibacillus silvisoli]|uniref:Ger(x)C family spore germination protein n=1 Tax=Paenibacillus silvisoli TaxID=3110539 RepID=UPI0028045EFB|nr:Ger(x)C family spore germination protein [Paenibacillus silvisoli]
MKIVRRRMLWIALFLFTAGCSPDEHEISDVALIMITGIDYDDKKHTYVLTNYCIQATTKGTDKTDNKEWLASASGNSLMDAARNLQGRAGKMMIANHDKFFIIGENAARHSFYEVVDLLTRSREIRMSSYVIVSEGMAADKLKIRSETGDLLSNEFLGKTINEVAWGKSVSLKVKDVANYYNDPFRGFVAGRLISSQTKDSARDVLLMQGGSVFNKGKLVGWLKSDDVLSLHLLTKKKELDHLEFPFSLPFMDSQVTVLLQPIKKTIRSSRADGKLQLEIELHLKGQLVNVERKLPLTDPQTIHRLETETAAQVKQNLDQSLAYFQRGLKVDVVGFSDYLRRHEPKEWKTLKTDWDNRYTSFPIKVNVDVNIFTLGMSDIIGGS